MLAATITIPAPDEIKRRIVTRRAEIQQLKKLLKMANAATNADEHAQANERDARKGKRRD